MRVADRAGERVGGVGAGVSGQSEQPFHHVLHLFFFCVALADHGLLDLQRSVLRDREARDHRRADRGAARLAQQQRGLRIHIDEDLLDRHLLRAVRCDDFGNSVQKAFESSRQIPRAGFDATAGDVAQAPGILLDDAEARDLQPRIDAQDFQSTTAVV